MTKAQAEKILKEPRFGDAKCIEAIQRLEDELEMIPMREFLKRRGIACDSDLDLEDLACLAERWGYEEPGEA